MKVSEMKKFVEGVATGFEAEPEERLFTAKEVANILRQTAVNAAALGVLLGVIEDG